MKKVLFICMGNICRSSMAEGILRDKIQKRNLPLEVDSAGTHRYHNGEQYDARARATLKIHDINVDDLRSRLIQQQDFEEFDVLFAADSDNIRLLKETFGEQAERVQLMTAYSEKYQGQAVPDPYYGGAEGFPAVYDMLDESIECWLENENL